LQRKLFLGEASGDALHISADSGTGTLGWTWFVRKLYINTNYITLRRGAYETENQEMAKVGQWTGDRHGFIRLAVIDS